jgi:predicted RNase H-like HicB family nuclease
MRLYIIAAEGRKVCGIFAPGRKPSELRQMRGARHDRIRRSRSHSSSVNCEHRDRHLLQRAAASEWPGHGFAHATAYATDLLIYTEMAWLPTRFTVCRRSPAGQYDDPGCSATVCTPRNRIMTTAATPSTATVKAWCAAGAGAAASAWPKARTTSTTRCASQWHGHAAAPIRSAAPARVLRCGGEVTRPHGGPSVSYHSRARGRGRHNIVIPAFPHGYTCGDTIEECLANAREVIELEIAYLSDKGLPIPKSDSPSAPIEYVSVPSPAA